MRESRLGIIISIAVHSCVIPLLVAASFAVASRPVRVVEVDFSLIKGQLMEYRAPEAGKEALRNRPRVSGGGSAAKKVEPTRLGQENPENLPAKEQVEPPPAPTIVTASDALGETVIHGVAATYADASGSISSLRSHGGATDGMQIGRSGGGSGEGQGEGRGNGQGPGEGLAEGGRDYNYIREAIMRNIRYPDEAIRLGFEGQVLLSFIVLENGTTSKIKVVSGSGFRLLDDSAKEAVAITHINRKVPYRVVVHLPITYKLQGIKG